MRLLLAILAVIPSWRAQPFTKGQKALSAIAVVLVLLMALISDVAVFGFLLDAAFLDVFILLLTIQLQLFGEQLSALAALTVGRVKRLFKKSEENAEDQNGGA